MYASFFVLLGAFWGLSPSFYKVMGTAMPITHIIVLTGVGVGVGLYAVGRVMSGRLRIDRRLALYGLGCGTLLNGPFALQILFSQHVPATVLAIVFSTSPFVNYLLAVAARRDRIQAHRMAALLAGFSASALLVLTRGDASVGDFSLWTLASFVCPLLFAFYNWFTSACWPEGVGVYEAGMAESFASALAALPFMLVLAPFSAPGQPALAAYWPVLGLTLMWVVERIVYYTLIRDKGPVYSAQATYVATPAGVLYGIAFFSEQPDVWLLASLALVLLALWLNNARPPRLA